MMPFFSKTAAQSSTEPTYTPKCRLAEHNRRNRNYSRAAGLLRSQKGDITIYTCFFIVGAVMLVSFLLLYASIRITCINIRNGAKMELNNLSASIYADTFRSQRETNFSEYLNTLYSDSSYVAMLEETVTDGLANKEHPAPVPRPGQPRGVHLYLRCRVLHPYVRAAVPHRHPAHRAHRIP